MTPASSSLSFPFVKMHGLGNDFIVIDSLNGGASDEAVALWLTPERARELCDRRFGIGADQILWLKRARSPARSKGAVAAMEVINADGSRAEMCGNGIRAVALYLDGSLAPESRKPAYLIETGAGVLRVEILPERRARVEMGVPEIGNVERLRLGSGHSAAGVHGERGAPGEKEIEFLPVSLGNPHAVIFVEDPWKYPVEEQGAEIERNPRFPNRTNVEFARATDEATLVVRVWERGAGLTLACGTGACASAVAAILDGRCRSPVEVKLPGGSLKIEWAGRGKPVLMSGPAVEVFRGVWRG